MLGNSCAVHPLVHKSTHHPRHSLLSIHHKISKWKQATSSLPEALALLMVKSLFLHHHITKHAQEDFLSLLDALFPENNKLPKILYKFDKRLDQFMKKEEDTITVHYYCKQCYATQPSPLQYHNIDNGQFHSILSYGAFSEVLLMSCMYATWHLILFSFKVSPNKQLWENK